MKIQKSWISYWLYSDNVRYSGSWDGWVPEREARWNFSRCRGNGKEVDNDRYVSWEAVWDGSFDWIKGEVKGGYVYGVKRADGDYDYEVRYTAGRKDLEWFVQKDKNYLRRIQKEGNLRKQEPSIWYLYGSYKAGGGERDIGEWWQGFLENYDYFEPETGTDEIEQVLNQAKKDAKLKGDELLNKQREAKLQEQKRIDAENAAKKQKKQEEVLQQKRRDEERKRIAKEQKKKDKEKEKERQAEKKQAKKEKQKKVREEKEKKAEEKKQQTVIDSLLRQRRKTEIRGAGKETTANQNERIVQLCKEGDAQKLVTRLELYNITKLKLAKMDLDDLSVKTLAGALEQYPKVFSLDLSCNRFGTQGTIALCRMLQKNKCLLELDLSGNQISSAAAGELGTMLQQNSTLRILALDNNPLEEKGVSAIARSLEENQALTALYLLNTHAGQQGAEAIAGALQKNKTLVALGFELNKIGTSGAEDFAIAMQENTALIELYLSYNQISIAGLETLGYLFDKNTTLTVLELTGNEPAEAVLKEIAGCLERNRQRVSTGCLKLSSPSAPPTEEEPGLYPKIKQTALGLFKPPPAYTVDQDETSDNMPSQQIYKRD